MNKVATFLNISSKYCLTIFIVSRSAHLIVDVSWQRIFLCDSIYSRYYLNSFWSSYHICSNALSHTTRVTVIIRSYQLFWYGKIFLKWHSRWKNASVALSFVLLTYFPIKSWSEHLILQRHCVFFSNDFRHHAKIFKLFLMIRDCEEKPKCSHSERLGFVNSIFIYAVIYAYTYQ